MPLKKQILEDRGVLICKAAVVSPHYLVKYDNENNFKDISLEEFNNRTYEVGYFSRIIGPLEYEINGFQVFVASPLTFIMPTSNQQNCVDRLVHTANKILFDMFLGGIKTYAIRNSDIGAVEINSHGFYMLIEANASDCYLHNVKLQQKDYSTIDAGELYFRQTLTYDSVCKSIKDGKSVSSKFEISNDFLLNGFRYYDNREFSIAHVLFWSYLEALINWAWLDHARKLNLTKSKKFFSNKLLSSATKIGFLRLSGVIDERLYERIDNSRKKRNESMHYMQSLTKNDCKECIAAIRDLFCAYFPENKELFSTAFDQYLKEIHVPQPEEKKEFGYG